jgi:PTS system nitrogen regulatory IIA component
MQALSQLMSPGRTLCREPGASKKRIFDTIARAISDDQLSLTQHEVFTQLVAREKLGSTGLGKGIAIPHSRIANCSHPLGSLITLAEPVDFDAPDNQPVDLLFVLLVPEEAQQQHLDILAEIARLFSQDDFCQYLRAAQSNEELHQRALSWQG